MKKSDQLYRLSMEALVQRDFQLTEKYLRKAIILNAFDWDKSQLNQLFDALARCLHEQKRTEEALRIGCFAEGLQTCLVDRSIRIAC